MSMPSSRALVATTPEQFAGEKVALDLPAVFRQIAGAVGLDALGQRRLDAAQFIARVGIDQFGQAAGAGKGQRADILYQQFGKKVGGFGIGAAARALCRRR